MPAIWEPIAPKVPLGAAPVAADTLDMTTPVAQFDKNTAQAQVKLTIAQLPFATDPIFRVQLGMRVTALQQRIAHLEQAEKPKPPPDLGPKMVPIAQLGSVRDLAEAIGRERAFLASPLARHAAPSILRSHEHYLETLIGERNRLVNEYRSRPEVQKLRLYAQLHALGDTSGCRADDTLDDLQSRVAALTAKRASEAAEREANQQAIGLDGKTGTARDVATYEMGERINCMSSSILASLAGAAGASTEEMRAWRDLGEMLEGVGMSVGAIGEARRAPHPDTTEPVRITSAEGRLSVGSPPRLPRSAIPTLPPARGTTDGTAAVMRAVAPLPREAAPRAIFTATQRTPSGKHWAARDLSFDEFKLHYRACIQSKGLSDEKLRAEYDAGKRFNPETKKMTLPGAAVYATTDDTLRVEDVPQPHHAWIEAAARERASAKEEYERIKNKPGATPEKIDAAFRAWTTATQKLGEIGADAYVAARYPGPPPPQILWPVGAARDTSRPSDFDRVYKVADKYGKTRIVVEAKGGGADLSTRKIDANGNRAEQGTRRYLDTVIRCMQRSSNPAMQRVGDELDAVRNQIEYIEVRTPGGPPLQVVGREFELNVDTGVRP